jgi:predicted unusual protein kinase regulating ubiquinone biosynthesis (AarF/ABC1/UbiB family)
LVDASAAVAKRSTRMIPAVAAAGTPPSPVAMSEEQATTDGESVTASNFKMGLQFTMFNGIKPRLIRSLFLTLAVYLFISSTISSIQSRRRRALDATSEWGRYASQPAARGRAVMVLFLRLLPYWIRQRFLTFGNASKKAKIRTASGAIFAQALLQLGPLYIKLGQILSCRDNLLPSEWMVAMEQLQDKVPAKSGTDALELAYTAMGSQERFHEVFSDFEDVPLAAASLGQVHRATLRQNNKVVAVKLQRPRLREIYDQDLALLTKIAKTVDAIGGQRGQVGGVSQSWTTIFDDAKSILYREIDYRAEADNCVRFNTDFGLSMSTDDDKGSSTTSKRKATMTATSLDGTHLPSAASWLKAPHVYRELSSEQALVMEYVPSIKITNTAKLDAANVTAADREYLAESLARAYLRCFCAHRFFSTDPHPGNLGVELLPSGNKTAKSSPGRNNVRLVMYDFGQACELQEEQSEGILNVIEAIIDIDSDRCVEAFAKMGVLKEGANLTKIRAKVQNNFETGKVVVKRKKMKKAGYKFKNDTATPAIVENDASSPSSTATPNEEKAKDSEVMSFFTLPAEYAFVARALSQMDGVGKTLDPDFDFISCAAPYIVEVKGTGTYIKDEWSKWVRKAEKKVLDWQKPFL